ncbi:3-hydroxyanthranilate 3,4-dioxygenase [Phaeodactylibacter luteus]|uniref:3-hydroxyanthranilate 3,4-dioxygenase n=1 Tax=Phaeodactylibacter luteus TaxID=1564516 RepID=A0A5C6RIJ7_9BACT|nr:3-hydroxyanthranilate 3,4-dioxygenase [Phaeodactylibacter luteus]TXB62111.1 3-hydroxyanthranilate 3,4-dioxygenase [Phaeodactylibacter luteus]
MPLAKPFNLQKWVDDNRHLLKPPVGNQQVFKGNDDYIVMVVGGPNGRKDYHWEEGEELFYQLEGDITLKIINEDGTPEDIQIREGEMFLLPPRIPHSPQRPANTVGMVIERYRREGEEDKLMWFCESCNHKLHEASFPLKDIVAQLKSAIEGFMSDEALRTCGNCGTVMEKG